MDEYPFKRKGKIRQELDLELEDPKYDGQKVSREKVLNGASSDEEEFDPFAQGDDGDADELGSFSDEDSVDEAAFSHSGSDEDEDSDSQGNSDEDNEEEEEEEQSMNGETLDPSSVQAELQELQKEEKKMIFNKRRRNKNK